MPGLKAVVNGKEGEVDVYSAIKANMPDAKILDFNPGTMQAKLQMPDGTEGDLDVRAAMAQEGIDVKGSSGDFNKPETPLQSSPLGFVDRAALGLLSSESTDMERIKQLLDIGDKAAGGKGWDAWASKNENRALTYMKKNFDDVKVVGDEFVVKKGGNWYKANASGFDKGDAAEFLGQSGLNLMGAIAGGSAGAAIGTAAGPIGTAVGGIAGGLLGDTAAEAGEELLANGIAYGKLKASEIGANLGANAIMSMAGEVGGITARGLIKGLASVTTKASSGVKDLMAKLVPAVGGTVSEEAYKHTTASRENLQAVSKHILRADQAAAAQQANPVVSEMIDITKDFIKKSKEQLHADFGARLDKIAPKIADAGYKLDVADVENVVKNAMELAPDDAGKYAPLMRRIDMLKSQARSTPTEVDGTVSYNLLGEKAVRETRNLIELARKTLGFKQLKEAKAFEKITGEQAAGRYNVVDFLDQKILSGAQAANTDSAMAIMNQRYGIGNDAIKGLERLMSTGGDKAEQTARYLGQPGKGSNDFMRQIDNLKALGIGGVDNVRKELVSREAAMQFSPMLLNAFTNRPTLGRVGSIVGLAAAGGAATGDFGYITNTVRDHPILSAAVGTLLLSPRGTLKAMQGVSAVKSGLKAATVPFDQAAMQARGYMNTARAIGGISRLNDASRNQLLQNADLFSSYVQQVQSINANMERMPAAALATAREAATPGNIQGGQGGK